MKRRVLKTRDSANAALLSHFKGGLTGESNKFLFQKILSL